MARLATAFDLPPRPRPGRRWASFLLGSLLLHGAILAASWFRPPRLARPAVAVQFLVSLPPPSAAPTAPAQAPPAQPPPRLRRHPAARAGVAAASAIAPRAPAALAAPPPAPARGDAPDLTALASGDAGEDAGGHGGQEGRSVGSAAAGDEDGAGFGLGGGSGAGGGVGEGRGDGRPGGASIPARPGDLAAVQAGIHRCLVYPPRALKARWQGRVFLAFILRADGAVSGLQVARSSGIALLDEAALAAVERAAPFPPPGLDVRVEIPVVFRLA